MRLKKTRDILELVRQFHQAVSDHCEQVSGATDAKRLKLLLDYISEREQSLADALTVFTEQTPAPVLDTWFQYTGDDTAIYRLLDSNLNPAMTEDDLLRLILRITDHFSDLYSDMVTASPADKVRAVFQNLLDEELKGKEQLARNFQMMADL
ncbi:MAG: hypothetical protein ACC648_02125 [Thiohalobacterales bacterium]